MESVLAGTRSFVTAITPAVKTRAGAEPRVAADPRQAFIYCSEAGGLLVMEYAGPEWLPVIRDLRSLCGDAIRMVVAVAQERTAEISGLQRAGADEVVAWDGRADPVAWAVERVLAPRVLAPDGTGPARGFHLPVGGPPEAEEAPAPAGPAPAFPLGPAGGAPAPRPPSAAFTIREVPAPFAAPSAAAEPSSAVTWPSGVLAGPDAERLLAAIVTGAATEPGPEKATAAHTAQALSDLERRALADVPLSVDAALFRRASGLRLRVALALGSAPPAGSPIDSAAVQSLLAELDATLAELKAAAEADQNPHPGIAVLRKALVKEAIDLTDAVHRVAPAQAPAAALASPARPATRVLSNRAGAEEAERPPLKRGWIWVLAVAALAAGGFHLQRWLARPVQRPPPTLRGAPENSLGTRMPRSSLLMESAGKEMSPVELERFRQLEESKGNRVLEIGPGAFLVEPREVQPPAPPSGVGERP